MSSISSYELVDFDAYFWLFFNHVEIGTNLAIGLLNNIHAYLARPEAHQLG